MRFFNIALTFTGIMLLFSCDNESGKQKSTSESKKTQSESEISFNQYYYGNIYLQDEGKEKPISFYMHIDTSENGKIKGEYYYISMKRPLELEGQLKNDSIYLKEYYNDKFIGDWKGKISENGEINGTWGSKSVSVPFRMGPVNATMYDTTLNPSVRVVKPAVKFEEVLELFEYKEFPYEISENKSDGNMDTSMVQQFFEPELVFEGVPGFYDFTSVYYTKTEYGYFMTMFEFYTPGAFGINNSFLNVYTFDENGNLIDSQEIGCFCHDTNMGANDYYESSISVYIDNERIEVEELNTYATLAPEVEKEEDVFHNESYEYYQYSISSKGKVSKIEGD